MSPRQAYRLAIRAARGTGLARTPYRTVRPSSDRRYALRRVLSPHAAVVRDRDARHDVVMQSAVPLRARTRTGALLPTDLSVEPITGGFRPKNAPSRLTIGRTAEAGVAFDEGGFAIGVRGGDGDRAIANDTGVFHANSHVDTDTVVTPTFRGATIDFQLRSARSPERFELVAELPPGARLAHAPADPSVPERPPGVIRVERGGRALGHVYPAIAYDADGVPVPTRTKIHGDTIVEEVEHRDGDFRYPIYVDPETTQTFAWGGDWNGWVAANYPAPGCAAGYRTQPQFTLNNPNYAPGMFIGFPNSSDNLNCFAPGQSAQFTWQAPANTYIGDVRYFNFAHATSPGVAGYTLQYGGVHNSNLGWVGGMSYQNGAAPNPYSFRFTFAGAVGEVCFWVSGACDRSNGTTGRYDGGYSFAVFGLRPDPYALYMGTTNWARATAENINVYLAEKHRPTVSLPGGTPTGGWVDDSDSRNHGLSVRMTDVGLGGKWVNLSGAASGMGTITNGCSGDWQHSPCPLDATTAYSYTLNEGTTPMTLKGADVVANASNVIEWTERIDRSDPNVPTLGGELADKQDGWLAPRAHSLDVNASDAFSGVSSLVAKVASASTSIPCTNPCAGTKTWSYAPASDNARRTITVTAKDAVGRTRSTPSFDVATDQSAPAIIDLAHDGVPSGWTDDRDGSMRVSLDTRDGDSGIDNVALKVPGSPDQTRDFSCNAKFANPCPTAPSRTSLDYRTTAIDGSEQIPEGDNTLKAVATDATGQTAQSATWRLLVDRTAPTINFSGALYDRRSELLTGSGEIEIVVAASDGSTASDAEKRSGVVALEAFVDGTALGEPLEQDCGPGSCSMTRNYAINPSDYLPGEHVLEVAATDALGHETVESVIFRTGPCCASSQATWATDLLAWGSLSTATAFGDVDGDGRADIVSRQNTTGQLQAGLSNGSSTFTQRRSWGNLPGIYDFRLADVNEDGFDDAVGRDGVTGDIYAALSNGGLFASPVLWGRSDPGSDFLLGHVNGQLVDSDALGVDLVQRNRTSGAVTVSFATGTGWASAMAAGDAPSELRLSLADMTGDGLDDLVAYDPSSRALRVGNADGSGFAALAAWGTSTNPDPRFGDMNADGTADVVSRAASASHVDVQTSDGETLRPVASWGGFASAHALYLADVDGDSRDDAVGNTNMGEVAVARSRMALPVYEVTNEPEDASVTPDYEDLFTPPSTTARSASTAQVRTAPKMRLMWQDDERLIGRYLAPATPAEREPYLDRMVEAGATDVRFVVYWGRWTADRGYRNQVKAAIADARSRNLVPYVTLTGAEYDERINGDLTNVFHVDAAGGFTSPNAAVTPSIYADFVKSVVTELQDPLYAVRRYGIWNEPNLDGGTFLKLECPGAYAGRARLTADLYRELYKEGSEAVKAVDPSLHVFLGELSEQTALGRRECHDPKPVKNGLNTIEYLEAVAHDPGDRLVAKGVAWHPYQHAFAPMKSAQNAARSAKLVGISYVEPMIKAVERLTSQGKLSVSSQKESMPGLFLTEFGYLNRPYAEAKGRKKRMLHKKLFHDERTRRDWYRQALRRAATRVKTDRGWKRPRMFSIYGMAEDSPAVASNLFDPRNFRNSQGALEPPWDTGVVAYQDPDGPQSEPDGYPRGDRDYGKGGSQARLAYCAIRKWALGYYRPRTFGSSPC